MIICRCHGILPGATQHRRRKGKPNSRLTSFDCASHTWRKTLKSGQNRGQAYLNSGCKSLRSPGHDQVFLNFRGQPATCRQSRIVQMGLAELSFNVRGISGLSNAGWAKMGKEPPVNEERRKLRPCLGSHVQFPNTQKQDPSFWFFTWGFGSEQPCTSQRMRF